MAFLGSFFKELVPGNGVSWNMSEVSQLSSPRPLPLEHWKVATRGEHFPMSFSLDCSHNLITSALILSLSDLIHCWNSIHHWFGADLLPGPQAERHSILHGRHLDSPHRVAYIIGTLVELFGNVSMSSI